MEVLDISTRRHGRFDIVALRGELDLAGAAELRRHLRATRKTSDDLLVLDLGELSFIDSTGLSILVEYHTKTNTAGGGMVLIGVRPAVAKVLSITGLDTELRIAKRLDDAVAELEQIRRDRPEEAEAALRS